MVSARPTTLLSRWAACTPAVIERSMRAVAAGRDLDDVIPGFSGHQMALVARDALEVAEVADLERRDLALVRQVECIAEGLREGERHSDGNTLAELRDLAICHLKLGDYRAGLALLSALTRSDPSEPWGYNVMSLDLPAVGLPSLGRLAVERGIELVGRGDDPDELGRQLRDRLREIGPAEDRSDAPADAVADLRDALGTSFDVVRAESLRDLAVRLVPDVAKARVKELPAMPTAEALAAIGARLRPLLPDPPRRPELGSFDRPVGGAPPVTRSAPKVGRNDPCACGSGKKSKKCCAA